MKKIFNAVTPVTPVTFVTFVLTLTFLVFSAAAFLEDDEIAARQIALKNLPVGERIASWAESFVGVPYDTEPVGAYVKNNVIVYDDAVDCMYITFRAVELALGDSPRGAMEIALDKRFITRGKINENGKVVNYDDRFQYGEDMIESGKWGREITRDLGAIISIKGERGRANVDILPKEAVFAAQGKLMSGDIVFLIKKVEKRVVGEIVGHIGIIKREGGQVYMIHASGRKGRDAKPSHVKKVKLSDYVGDMGFIGIKTVRFE